MPFHSFHSKYMLCHANDICGNLETTIFLAFDAYNACELNFLRIDLQETNFLISLGVPFSALFRTRISLHTQFHICMCIHFRAHEPLIVKSCLWDIWRFGKADWDKARLVGCVESIGSFQLSMCFIKACRASAHAQRTKQNGMSRQRKSNCDIEYRKSSVSSGIQWK